MGCELEELEKAPAYPSIGSGVAFGPGPAGAGGGGVGGNGGDGGFGGGAATTATGMGGFDPVGELSPFCGCLQALDSGACSICAQDQISSGCATEYNTCEISGGCPQILQQIQLCPQVDTMCLNSATMGYSQSDVVAARNLVQCQCQTCSVECPASACN